MAKKILVIDDDPVGGALMKSRLAKEGYEVMLALNGDQGLKALASFSPGLIVLDVEMPEMNGYTFVGEIQKIDAAKNTPIIVLTAHEENKKIFARKGISHYLVKPVDFNLLFAQMNELMPS